MQQRHELIKIKLIKNKNTFSFNKENEYTKQKMETPKINWFPGHMAKAMKEVKKKIHVVDLILEVRDARVPISSGNCEFEKQLFDKKRIILMNKSNQADSSESKIWETWFARNTTDPILFMNALDKNSIKKVLHITNSVMKDKRNSFLRKGINPSPIRAIVLGLPNTGKSTLINRLVKKSRAKTGPTPGVTKHLDWIRIGREIELLDTPGIMPPKIETNLQGYWLSCIHAIHDKILGPERIVKFLFLKLMQSNQESIKAKYGLSRQYFELEPLLETICGQLNCYKSGNKIDYPRAYSKLLHQFRKGEICNFTFETLNQRNLEI